MAGARDPICSLTATRWTSERIPNTETLIFERSGHVSLMEKCGKFMAAVSNGFEQHSPRPWPAARKGDG
jgi:pimeloyl-ACP methyl ester carboxylesterase